MLEQIGRLNAAMVEAARMRCAPALRPNASLKARFRWL